MHALTHTYLGQTWQKSCQKSCQSVLQRRTEPASLEDHRSQQRHPVAWDPSSEEALLATRREKTGCWTQAQLLRQRQPDKDRSSRYAKLHALLTPHLLALRKKLLVLSPRLTQEVVVVLADVLSTLPLVSKLG